MPRVLTETDVADFRERLCGVAEKLFAEQGPDGVTMRQLASELGVSPMTPYRYFSDKDAILAAVRAAAFNRFAAALEAAYDSEIEPLARTTAIAQAYVDFALSEPAAYKLMFDLMQPHQETYPELVEAGMRARRTMTAHVEALIAARLLSGDADMIGHMFWAALHGTLVLQFARAMDSDIDPDDLRRQMLVALGRGLGLTVPA
jgi:AcrR family transcriptional regulator